MTTTTLTERYFQGVGTDSGWKERPRGHGPFRSQAAREANATGYGGFDYCASLDASAVEYRDLFAGRGDDERAESMLTRTLAEALRGNDGA